MTINPDLHSDDSAHRRELLARMRALRIRAGLRYADLAPVLYVLPDGVGQFERSQHRPRIAAVQRHARALGHVADLHLHGLTWQETADMRTYAAVAATAADPEVADGVARSLCIARLTAARRHQGLTRAQLAPLMGLKRTGIYQIEAERDDPLLSTYQRYARALGGRLTVELRPIATLERVEASAA